MDVYFIIHFIIIVALELPVYLYCFREEKMTAVHFAFLCNAFTFFITNFLLRKLGANYYMVQAFVFLLESVIVFFFWEVEFKKALLISLIANGLSFLFFEVVDKLHL